MPSLKRPEATINSPRRTARWTQPTAWLFTVLLQILLAASSLVGIAGATDLFDYKGDLGGGSRYTWSSGLAQISKPSEYERNYCVELGLGVRGLPPDQIPKGQSLATVALVPAVGWLRYDAKSYPLSAVGTNNNGASGDGDKPISHINQSPFVYQNTGELKFWTPSGFRLASVGQDPRAVRKIPGGTVLPSPLVLPGQVLPLNSVSPDQASRWPNSGYGLTALIPAECSGSASQHYNLTGTFRITSNNPTVTKMYVRVTGKIDAEYVKTDREYVGNNGYANAYIVVKGPDEQFWFGGESPSPITVGNGLNKPLLTVDQAFPAGRVVQGLVADKILSLPVGQPITFEIRGTISANGRANSPAPKPAIWATIKEHRLELKILDSGGSFTIVPPPVKPLTGGADGTTTTPGVVVVPGPSTPGTTFSRPAAGSSLGAPTPVPGGTALTPGVQRITPGTPTVTSPATGTTPAIQLAPLQLTRPATGGVQLALPPTGQQGAPVVQSQSPPPSAGTAQKPFQSSNFQIQLGGLAAKNITTVDVPKLTAKSSTDSLTTQQRAFGVVPRGVQGDTIDPPLPPPTLVLENVMLFHSTTGDEMPVPPGSYQVVEADGDVTLISVDAPHMATIRLAAQPSTYEGSMEESAMLWLPGGESDERLLLLLAPNGQGVYTIGTEIGIATRGVAGLQAPHQFLLPGGGTLRLALPPSSPAGIGALQRGNTPAVLPPKVPLRVMRCGEQPAPSAPKSGQTADQGRLRDDECHDMNPGALRVIVTNFLGMRSQGVPEDRTTSSDQVNQPISPPSKSPAAGSPPSLSSPTAPQRGFGVVPRGVDEQETVGAPPAQEKMP